MKKRYIFFITFLLSSVLFFSITLDFYCLAWQPQTVDEVYDLVDMWNEENPDVQINIMWGTWETSDEFLQTSFRGGNPPDIIHTDTDVLAEYGLMGFVSPLNNYISNEMLNDIFPWLFTECSDLKGNIYGVPWLQEIQVVFYNKDIFKENGITVPDNRMIGWDELLDIAQKVTIRDSKTGEVKRWGFLAPTMEYFHWALIEQNDGHVLVMDDKGKWKVEIDDNAKEAIEFYISLITKYKVSPPDVMSIDYTSLMQNFLNGRYAMVTFGCWNRRFLVQSKMDNWGMLLVTGKNIVSPSNPQGLGISKACKYKEEAFRFVEFLTNTENSADMAYADWLFPVRNSSVEDPRFRSTEYEWNILYSWLPYARNVRSNMPGYLTFEWQAFVPQIERVILGEITIDEAFKNIEKEGNKVLKRLGLQ